MRMLFLPLMGRMISCFAIVTILKGLRLKWGECYVVTFERRGTWRGWRGLVIEGFTSKSVEMSQSFLVNFHNSKHQSKSQSSSTMSSNTFDDVLSLEEGFYESGRQQGIADGIKAGRIEGRTFGLEKGFEKFAESGRLYGKSIIWANRLPKAVEKETTPVLPPLADYQRLYKHVKVLHALSESASLSTENSEDAVSDFDDRLRRAQAKLRLIERTVGTNGGDNDARVKEAGSIEDVDVSRLKG